MMSTIPQWNCFRWCLNLRCNAVRISTIRIEITDISNSNDGYPQCKRIADINHSHYGHPSAMLRLIGPYSISAMWICYLRRPYSAAVILSRGLVRRWAVVRGRKRTQHKDIYGFLTLHGLRSCVVSITVINC